MNGMVMGYKNSPMIMQRTMNQIFDDMIGKSVMIYLDDTIIFDRDINEHKNNIEEVIRRLNKNNFRVNPLKIQFCQNVVKILGMIINGEEKVALSKKKKEKKRRKTEMYQRFEKLFRQCRMVPNIYQEFCRKN
ncbi:putative LTR retrotransposon [Pseudoloma neurophilia]|uniref:Putative LTR retrotransposon n=1 Tax=Pseudoloma neurophilia TaxID=146866 RepID=A0A0R0LQH5_9MICR|nr:putative LTR retrotransposon [Pseudoloma neurophilia]